MKATLIGVLVTATLSTAGYGVLFFSDARYVLAMDYQSQNYEASLANFRRDTNQLSREKLRAVSIQEKNLIQQQIDETERERRDFVERFKK